MRDTTSSNTDTPPATGRSLLVGLLVAMVALVISVAALGYFQLRHGLDALQADERQHRLQVVLQVVEQRLALYQEMVRAFAKDPALRDVLAFDDTGAAVAWSKQVRRLLPGAVGAALYAPDGGVLGDARAQRVGTQCELDLHGRYRGQLVSLVPVHDNIPALAHFDVSAPVQGQAGERLGLVFVSFSLDELFDVLAKVSADHGAAALEDTVTGRVFASSPNWQSLSDASELQAGVAGTDWQLRLRLSDEALGEVLPGLAWQIAAGVMVIVIGLLVAFRLLRRRFEAAHTKPPGPDVIG